MNATIRYRLSQEQDLEKIGMLLAKAELPVADLGHGKITFIVASDEKDEIVGCIGLEQIGEDGLLRSLAVDNTFRGKGIAHDLLNRLFVASHSLGIKNLHLLTTTAEKFFDRVGFLLRSRSEAPDTIKATTEFSSLCPSSSAYMVMKDIQHAAGE